MISSEEYKSFLNGGGSAAGVRGMASEIKVLETENELARVELCGVPALRIDLILADDPQAAIDKLESRERELERIVERNR